MGNEPKQQVRSIDPQLDFHSQVDHRYHGPIKVFSSKTLPMTFLMRLQRVSCHSRLYNYYQKIQDQQSPALLTLFGFKIQREEGCQGCNNGDRTLEYWQYLNYSLESHIGDRTRRGIPFAQSQMWHIIHVVLLTAGILAKFGLIWQVQPSSLVITPEGKLKADWSHLQTANNHLSYYDALYHNDTSVMGWFSPEEHTLLRERGLPNRLNLEKCNVYKFGLLLLSVTALIHEPILNERSWKQVIKFPLPIPNIINRCLQPDPRERPTLKQLYQQCEQHFSSSHQLMISQGRRQDFQQLNRQSKLKGEFTRANNRFHQIKEGSRHSRSFASNMQQRQSRGQTKYQTYDQRLLALKEYRRNLVFSRSQES